MATTPLPSPEKLKHQQQREGWQKELTTFWQTVERDRGIKRVFTDPPKPTFDEASTEFLGQLSYTPAPTFERRWNEEPVEKLYHVFTDGKDEWLESYDEALALFNKWATTYGSARLYEEYWENRQVDAEAIREDCLLSFGSYPG